MKQQLNDKMILNNVLPLICDLLILNIFFRIKIKINEITVKIIIAIAKM